MPIELLDTFGQLINEILYPSISALLVIAMMYIIKLLRQLVDTQACHNRLLYGESGSLETEGMIKKLKRLDVELSLTKRVIIELVYRLKSRGYFIDDEEFEVTFDKIK